MSRIDPIRRADLLRKAIRAEREEAQEAPSAEIVRLPAVIDPVTRIDARAERDGEAAFAAQLMGQDGGRRGLRAGQALFDAARTTYNRIEWSGRYDRRAPSGTNARTKI